MASMSESAMFKFDANDNWESLPEDISHQDVAAVGVDSRDRVFLLTRRQSLVLIYERDGTFVASWGEGLFPGPHGLTVGPDDSVYCVDNVNHTVRKFTPDGQLLMTLGTPGEGSDTGYAPNLPVRISGVESVTRPGRPFNKCTNLTIAKNNDLFVADGYGNCRVHRFSSEGELLNSWGEPGIGPGQFHLPHGIGVGPDENVYVCDRENDRVQVFDPDGNYMAEWNDVQRPTDIAFDADGFAYVSELWRFPGRASFVRPAIDEDRPGRVSIFDNRGVVMARWGASTTDRWGRGNFVAPHGIALDSQGDLYVAEVTATVGIRELGLPVECASHQIQKFTRVTL
jgi:DNA-binding beta-propeller fold protein YncE